MKIARTLEHSIGGSWGSDPTGNDDVAVVRVADFQYSRLSVAPEVPTFRSLTGPERASRLLKSGDILLEKSGGGLNANVGRAVLWSRSERAVCSNFIQLLRPRAGYLGDYLVYLHRSLYHLGVAASCTKQTTGIQNLDVRAYLSTSVSVPSIDRQRSTAAFLNRECAQIESAIHTADSLSRTLLEPALATFASLTFSAERTQVGHHYSVQLGKMLDGGSATEGVLVPYLRNMNVSWDRFSLRDVKEMRMTAVDRRRFAVRAGDLLACEGGYVGRSAIWDGEISPMYYQKALHRIRPLNDASNRFLMWCLWLGNVRGDFYADGTGSTIAHLPAEKLRRVRIPALNRFEQDAVTRQVDEISARAKRAANVSATLKSRLAEYRDALITEAVTGELDVTRVSETQMDERLHEAVESAT